MHGGQPQSHREAFRCSECHSPFFSPVDWEYAGRATWQIRFRCGACGRFERHVLNEDELEALERRLDQDTSEMLAAIELLARTDEVDVERLLREET